MKIKHKDSFKGLAYPHVPGFAFADIAILEAEPLDHSRTVRGSVNGQGEEQKVSELLDCEQPQKNTTEPAAHDVVHDDSHAQEDDQQQATNRQIHELQESVGDTLNLIVDGHTLIQPILG